jgi:glycosyltransferase involved in cell wall biosynthesis
MSETRPKPNISLFFPVYHDEATVRVVAEKAIAVLSEIANEYEIVIVNDGSPDRSGEVADQLAREFPRIKAIHHEKNMGYGKALQTGFANACKYEWTCFIDGDDQFDLAELRHMTTLLHRYDVLTTFRYCKVYSTWRMFVSWVYNRVLAYMFRSPFRDISCVPKMIRREVINNIDITSNSPFVGAEILLKAMLKGYLVGEVGISTYPREFGQSSSTSWPNIVKAIKDMLRVHKEVFANQPRPEVPT